MNDILFSPIRLNELEALIQNSVEKALKNYNKQINDKTPSDRWLDIPGLIDYHPEHPAYVTIIGKLASGEIPGHKKGKKWYFLKSEIDDYLKEGRKKTTMESQAEAEAFLSKSKNRK